MGLFIGNDFFWIVLPVLSDRETMARVSCPWQNNLRTDWV